ncbi:MAG: DUF6265 family protein [Pseudomonadales bacterium]
MRLIVLFLLCLLTPFAISLEPHTPHTFKLAEGEAPPDVRLEELAWLAGTWEGKAFGQTFEEVWLPPAAGTMLGMFKLMRGDEVQLYEIMEIARTDGRLGLKVKHFNGDFVAWEDKPDFVHFKLVGIERDAVHFSGISFYRHGPDRMTGWLVMRNGDDIREEKLEYVRK